MPVPHRTATSLERLVVRMLAIQRTLKVVFPLPAQHQPAQNPAAQHRLAAHHIARYPA